MSILEQGLLLITSGLRNIPEGWRPIISYIAQTIGEFYLGQVTALLMTAGV